MKSKRGLFISFEGSEGVGKSTQIQLLGRELKKLKRKIIITREPGGTPVGEKLRKIHKTEDVNPITELFVIEASRADHVSKVILPALSKNHIVICDRFNESTLVYQGFCGNIPPELIRKMNKIASQGIQPDLVFWMDLSWNEAKKRLKKRGGSKDRFDQAKDAFHKKLISGYRALAKTQKSPKLIRIDATRPVDEIHEEILARVSKALRQRF